MSFIKTGLLAILILAIQHFLSMRNNVWWGAIMPTVYIVLMFYLKLSGKANELERDFWFIAILGTVILLSTWTSGRQSLIKKRKKELEKMKSRDLK